MKKRLSILLALALWAALFSSPASPAADTEPTSGNASTLPTTREGGFMNYHAQYVQRVKQGNIDVLFTGDSITFKWGTTGKAQWDKYYGSLKAVNFGHSGDRTQHLLWRLQNGECDGPPPKVIVLMIGANNIGGSLYSVSDVAAGITANVNELPTQRRSCTSHKKLDRHPHNSKPNRLCFIGLP